MSMIDLRSDTITQPTPEMRAIMADAPVGDDVYGEDPSVNALEEKAAELLGKESALFTASGTMGNLIALLSHTRAGEEIILDANAHIYYYEAGGLSRLGGLTPRLIYSEKGMIRLDELVDAVRPEDVHFPRPSLFCLENTHNRAGGLVLPLEETVAVTGKARELGLKTHLDGARLFNAAAALELPVADLADPFDSVMCCLSKGLAAPVGSILAGSREFIAEARRVRKVVGGGMRQAGVIAAAGLWALEHMTKRLPEDHIRAQRLAAGLSEAVPFLHIAQEVQTNMFYFDLEHNQWNASRLVEAWADKGILASAVGGKTIRLVTHWQVDDAAVQTVIDETRRILASA